MWAYPRNRLSEGWDMVSLDHRIKAADQLGYDVQVTSTDEGVRVLYVKRVDVPWKWK
jgi:hypothetical protein